MGHLIYIGLTLAFLAACWGFVIVCEQLNPPLSQFLVWALSPSIWRDRWSA
jgi:hypothetical protein